MAKDLPKRSIKNMTGVKYNNGVYYVVYFDIMNIFIKNFNKLYGTLNDKNNNDTGGVYSTMQFISGLFKMFHKEGLMNNTLFNGVFEKGRSTKHKSISKDYKMNRDKSHTDFLDEFQDPNKITEEEKKKFNFKNELTYIKNIFKKTPILNTIPVDYTEGDFSLAYSILHYTKRLTKIGIPKEKIVHVVFSNDRDFLQLIDSNNINIIVYNFTKKKYITKDNFQEIFNIEDSTELLVEKILSGDTSDNIKGFSGIGPKRSKSVYQQIKNKLTKNFTDEDFISILKSENKTENTTIKKIMNTDKWEQKISVNYKLINIRNIDNLVNMMPINSIEKIKSSIDSYLKLRLKLSKKEFSKDLMSTFVNLDFLSFIDSNVLNHFTNVYPLKVSNKLKK